MLWGSWSTELLLGRCFHHRFAPFSHFSFCIPVNCVSKTFGALPLLLRQSKVFATRCDANDTRLKILGHASTRALVLHPHYLCTPQAFQDRFEARVVRLQRFVRRRIAHERSDGHGPAGFRVDAARTNQLRRLKRWVPRAVKRWKQCKDESGKIVNIFLRDARLTQNIKAIYRFRRKVIRSVLQFECSRVL